MAWKLNGTPIAYGSPFSDKDGNQYPGQWWHLSTLEEKIAAGVTEEADPAPVDGRFYYVSGDGPPVERPIEQIRKMRIDEVKAYARYHILQKFPEWKQANLTARGVELQDLWRMNDSWTAGEETEANLIKAAWGWVKLVRIHSDNLEAEINTLSFEELKTWQPTGWPPH